MRKLRCREITWLVSQNWNMNANLFYHSSCCLCCTTLSLTSLGFLGMEIQQVTFLFVQGVHLLGYPLLVTSTENLSYLSWHRILFPAYIVSVGVCLVDRWPSDHYLGAQDLPPGALPTSLPSVSSSQPEERKWESMWKMPEGDVSGEGAGLGVVHTSLTSILCRGCA